MPTVFEKYGLPDPDATAEDKRSPRQRIVDAGLPDPGNPVQPVSDYAKKLARGAVSAFGSGPGAWVEQAGGASNLRTASQDIERRITESLSPAGRYVDAQPFLTEDWKLGETWAQSLASGVVESVPSLAQAYLIGRPIQKAMAGANVAGRTAGALEKAGVPGRAAKGVGDFVERVPFGIAEGLQAGGQNAAQMKQQVEQMPLAELYQSPKFLERLDATDKSLPIEQREALARKSIADAVASEVLGRTTASTGAIGVLTGGGAVGMIAGKQAGRGAGEGFLRAAGKGMTEEAVQEVPQSGAEQLIQNVATRNYLNPDQNIWENVGQQAVQGGIQGAILGGGAAVAAHPFIRARETLEDPNAGPLTKGVAAGVLSGAVTPDGTGPAAPPPAAPPEAPTAAQTTTPDAGETQAGKPAETAAPAGLQVGQHITPEERDAAYDQAYIELSAQKAQQGVEPTEQEVVERQSEILTGLVEQRIASGAPAAGAAIPSGGAAPGGALAAGTGQVGGQAPVAARALANEAPVVEKALGGEAPVLGKEGAEGQALEQAPVEGQPAVAGQAPANVPHGTSVAPAVVPAAASSAVPVLQNRDRSSAASVVQMNAIAAAPDAQRLSFSRDFATGAPVVFANADTAQIPPAQLGAENVVVDAEGRRIPVRYAAIEADQAVASNLVDGTPVAAYADGQTPGLIRAVAGNGRLAGLQEAHRRGTAANYVEGIAADAQLHGVDPEAIRAMRAPVLVRIMRSGDVTPDIGDRSNVSGVAQLNPVEQARTDMARVNVEALEFAEDGAPTADSVKRFIQAMPAPEQASLMAAGGQPGRQASERLMAATFAKAYDSDELIGLYAQSTGPEARNVIAGLAQAAGAMSKLAGAGEFDLRPIVLDAVRAAVNASRMGVSLARFAQQADVGMSREAQRVVRFFAANSRSAKTIGEGLRKLADAAYNEASKVGEDIFGAVPRRTVPELLEVLDGQQAETSSAVGQPAGPAVVGRGADERQAGREDQRGAATAGGSGAPAEAGTEAGTEAGLTEAPFELAPPDIDALNAQERERQAKEAAEQAEQAKREAAPAPGDFRLEGSDRAVDKAEAAGQLPLGTVDEKANEAATSPTNGHPEPTEGQKDAGNYRKGHIRVNGLDISIENPAGSTRSGKDERGRAWSRKMVDHYGYIKRTEAADSTEAKRQGVDVFVKAGTPEGYSGSVFVVDQTRADGKFDEHKAMVGYANRADALRGYLRHYEKGWKRYSGITEMRAEAFREWALNGDTGKPVVESPRNERPAAPAKPAESAGTEDVGENLWYNRRNFTAKALAWDDIKDLNETLRVKEVAKVKVWPRPNYEQMVEDGLHPVLAHLMKQVYDSISLRPSVRGTPTDAQLRTYIETLGKVRDSMTEAVKALGNDRARLAAALRASAESLRNPFSRPGQDADIRNILLDRAWPTENEARKNYRFRENDEYAEQLRLIGGNKPLRAMQFDSSSLEEAAKAISEGWPTPQEAWQKSYDVREVEMRANDVTGAAPDGGAVKRWNVYRKKSRVFLASRDTPKEGFATRDEAVEHARALTKTQRNTEGQDTRGTNIEEAQRVGPPRRAEGENISSDKLKDTFGFRGVNFGRKGWINDAERQAYLNHSYDGLLDMAELMGVPPRAMSLNGMLGIAFGAQGRGGRAAAHFVPGHNEINLTKTMGAGTMAHEWGHALDHYFANQAGLGRKEHPFLSDFADRTPPESVYSGTLKRQVKPGEPEYERITGRADDTLRPEIRAAFDSIIQAMEKRMQSASEARERAEAGAAAMIERSRKNISSFVKTLTSNAITSGMDPAKAEAIRTKLAAIESDLLAGKPGDGHVQVGQKTLVYPKVAELRNALIEVGRRPLIDNIKGLQAWARSLKFALEANVAEKTHAPQLVRSDYRTASDAADKAKKGKAYWSTRWEMFARAFETYVQSKLIAAGQANTFLSDAHGRAADQPYPVEAERVAINDAFDALIGSIKTRETDKGVALYSRGQPAEPASPEVRTFLDAVAAKLSDRLPMFVADRPPNWMAQDAEGAYLNGRLYLFAANLGTTQRAQEVLKHEVFHAGLDKMGPEVGAVLLEIDRDNANVSKLADQWAAANPGRTREVAVNEALARLSETTDLTTMPWWQKLVTAIRAALRDLGFTMKWSDADIARFIHATREQALAGARGAGGTAPAYSSQPRQWYFSALQRAFEGTGERTMPGSQWAAWLNANAAKMGVKSDEIEWSGVRDWLQARGKEKTSRQDVLQFLREGGVRVSETILGASAAAMPVDTMTRDELARAYEEEVGYNPVEDNPDITDDELRELMGEVHASPESRAPDEARFDQYRVPGANTNYRELLLTLPYTDGMSTEEQNKIIESGGEWPEPNTFQSGHWPGAPNVLAHIRFDERTDADGKRVLFIEEIQSDWAQRGRKEGFANDLNQLPDDFYVELPPPHLVGKYAFVSRRRSEPAVVYGAGQTEAEALRNGHAAWRELSPQSRGVGVPRAPFVTDTKSWVALAIKRMVVYAVENGFDRVAFVTGPQSVEMFRLSQQVDQLRVIRSESGVYGFQAYKGNRRVTGAGGLDEQGLVRNIGKGLAQRAIDDLAEAAKKDEREVVYDGEAMDIGGEGNKAFYDQIVPQVARDVMKKLGGGKALDVGIRAEVTVPEARRRGIPIRADRPLEAINQQIAFDITPAMREKVTREGVPLFSRAQTKTPEFRRWFGDSKVVDTNGEPLVVYHGTNKSEQGDAFTMFDTYGASYGLMGVGSYFTVDPAMGSKYSGKGRGDSPSVYAVYLSITNPLDMDAQANVSAWAKAFPDAEAFHEGGDTNESWYRAAEDAMRDAEVPAYEGAEAMQAGIRSMGYDGITHMGGGRVDAQGPRHRVYVAFDPEQIKSATGNSGAFDPTNPDIRYSRRTPEQAARAAVETIANAAQNVRSGGFKAFFQRVKDIAATRRDMGLALLGRRQIVEIYENLVPALAGYNIETQKYDRDKNKTQQDADKIVSEWAKLPDKKLLAETMHGATLNAYDPDTSRVPVGMLTPEMRAVYDNFASLTPDAKTIYREARDMYAKQWAMVKEAIDRRIDRARVDENAKRALKSEMQQEFLRAMQGVYFPLARFGDFVVIVRGKPEQAAIEGEPEKPGQVLAVVRAESVAQARVEAERLAAAYPEGTVSPIMKSAEYNASRDSVSSEFIQKLYGAIETSMADSKEADDLKDAINQLWLTTLPDASWAKHGIHRKGTPGFSEDARRAFAANMFHGGYYLAKINHVDVMQDYLREMQEYVDAHKEDPAYDAIAAQQVVDEMHKRHELVMNPPHAPWSETLTATGFLYLLGASPAAALVNMSQTALVAYPMIGAEFGYRKTANAFALASKQAAMNVIGDLAVVLKGDELAAYNRAVDEGVIDTTQAHDLAAVSEGRDVQLQGKFGPFMKMVSSLFHHAEKFNRQATFLAAYRLARAAGNGHDQSYDTAYRLTYASHFDYAQSNRPRVMMGPTARMILLFKQYGQNMAYALTRNMLKATQGDPTARRNAVGLLTAAALAAGIRGLPWVMVGMPLAIASALGGSDDEPWDAEVALRNYLADNLGKAAGEMIMHGVLRGVFPGDVSSRVDLSSLFIRDIDLTMDPNRIHEELLKAVVGPVGSIFANAFRGASDWGKGDLLRGFEQMIPKAIADVVKGVDYGMHGVRDRTGVEMLSEVNLAEAAAQVVGFVPARLKESYEGRRAVMDIERRLNERHNELLARFSKAVLNHDDENRLAALEEIRAFNEKQPMHAISARSLLQSVQNRARRIAEAQDGIALPRRHRPLADEGRFANIR